MKSESRVKNYKPGSEDWKAEYAMFLDDGLTCNDCVHVTKCCSLFGQSPYADEGKCQFYPNRFYPKKQGVRKNEIGKMRFVPSLPQTEKRYVGTQESVILRRIRQRQVRQGTDQAMLVGKAQRVFRVSEKNREAGMKKVIELLEQAKALIWNPPTLEVEKKFLDVTVSKIIEEAISELQALTNGETLEPVQVLNHVIYETTEALKFLDIAPCPDRDIGNVIEYNLEDGIDRLRNLIGAINKPRWETPEQWEQRTGEPWHGNWAVYVRLIEENYRGPDSVEWAVNTYKNVRKWHDDSQIVCATEAGPPPNNWRPEEEK